MHSPDSTVLRAEFVANPTDGVSPGDRATQAVRSASSWRDSLGIIASVGCAIHCAAMPFVIAYLPMLGLSFLADEAFHRWMALTCFLIAMAAFIPGFRVHGRWMPGMIAAVALVMITAAAFGLLGDCCAACAGELLAEPSGTVCTDACCEHCLADAAAVQSQTQAVASDETYLAAMLPLNALGPWITPLGGLLLVSAHLLNRRYGCRCGCCESATQ